LGFEINKVKNIYRVFDSSILLSEAIIKTAVPNLDIITSNIDLVAAEIELVDQPEREYILKKALNSIKKRYDFIIIDCAPSLGLITLNALASSDSTIIPIQCEYFALEGLGKLLNTIKSVQKIHNKNLEIEGLLLTMYDTRLRLSNQVVEEVQKHFGKMVFKTIIQRNVKLGEAPSYGEDIISYDATCRGAKNYLSLGNEIIKKNKF
jgi:chromosome partitioning protein